MPQAKTPHRGRLSRPVPLPGCNPQLQASADLMSQRSQLFFAPTSSGGCCSRRPCLRDSLRRALLQPAKLHYASLVGSCRVPGFTSCCWAWCLCAGSSGADVSSICEASASRLCRYWLLGLCFAVPVLAAGTLNAVAVPVWVLVCACSGMHRQCSSGCR